MKKLFSSIIPVVLVGMIVATDTAGGISISVSDGTVEYGQVAVGASVSTLSPNDMQIATNNGDVAEKFSIKGQDSANWTLESAIGVNQYTHGFCVWTTEGDCDEAGNFTPLTTDYATLAASVAINGAVNFHLQITAPNPNTVVDHQHVDVTILAVEA
jgi:hypothetical protein